VSYFERCQDWLLNGGPKSVEALNGALQGIERKLSALSDRATEDYQDLECTLELLQEQLELLAQSQQTQVPPSAPVPELAPAAQQAQPAIAEPGLDFQGLHPLETQPINLTQQQKQQTLENLLTNPLLVKGMPKS